MTTAAPAAPVLVERARVAACAFCRKRLGGEYHFTCRVCEASYCYIHMSRHQPASCARQDRRRARHQASRPLPVKGGNPLLLTGSLSSANV